MSYTSTGGSAWAPVSYGTTDNKFTLNSATHSTGAPPKYVYRTIWGTEAKKEVNSKRNYLYREDHYEDEWGSWG